MAKVGSLGDIKFTVSSSIVRTFDSFKASGSANFTEHKRHLQGALLEFTGTNAGTVSFSILLSAYLGVNPRSEADKLRAYMQEGKVLRLVVGGKVFGRYKWVITNLSEDYTRFTKKGVPVAIKVSVSLKEYLKG